MGIFISIMNRSIDWLALKTESPMNRVAEWFIKYDLEEYTQTFEDYGWDNLPVLLEMTEKDIGLCIQKPGHKAKFKRALRYLKIELDNPIATDRSDLHEETNRDVVKAATVETESKSTEEKFVTYTKKSTAEAYSSEQGHYATSISENVQFKSNTNTAALSPTDTDEIKEPMSTIDNVDDKQFIIAPEEIQVPGIVHMINNNDEDNVQAELTNICTHTAHERDGIIKDVTNTNSS